MHTVSFSNEDGPSSPDSFTETFFSRIPESLHATFTDAQLDAIKLAFGARGWGRHAIDVRRSIPTPFGRHYIVVLLGRERRQPHRWLNTRVGKLALSIAILAGLGVFALTGVGAAYTAKRAMGIDVVPGIDMLPDEDIRRWLE